MNWRTFSQRLAVSAAGFFVSFLYLHFQQRYESAREVLYLSIVTFVVALAACPWDLFGEAEGP